MSLHDRHVRFDLPDPVFAAPERDRIPGIWMAGATARESDLLQAPGVGCFVRALLPIKLTGGHKLTYGVWLGVDPHEFPSIFQAWWTPSFVDLRITGLLANEIKPWGLLGAPVEAGVRHEDQAPYCEHSSNSQLNRVLRDEWPHDIAIAGE